MKRRHACSIVLAVLGLLVVPAAASAASATATGQYANEDWTVGHVDNITVTEPDLCSGAIECWRAFAGAVPAATGCPPEHYSPFSFFWWTGWQYWNGTVESGPLDFELNGAASQRLCIYIEYEWPRESQLLYSSPIPQQDQPAPNPGPGSAALTERQARSETKAALKRRYGKRYRKGDRKRLSCVQQGPADYRCKVGWRYRDYKYSGKVRVILAANGPVATSIAIVQKPIN